jgi:hypothetical protein
MYKNVHFAVIAAFAGVRIGPPSEKEPPPNFEVSVVRVHDLGTPFYSRVGKGGKDGKMYKIVHQQSPSYLPNTLTS